MEYKLKKTVVLVGMMGVGKTVIGRGFAKRLRAKFVDLDSEIVKAANLEIKEIFENYGEKFFREKESKVLARLIFNSPIVLASGGGIFTEEKNQRLISDNAISIWLKSDPKIIWDRIKNSRNRPLIIKCESFNDFKKIYESRVNSYQKADICVSNECNLSIDEMIEKTFQDFCDYNDLSSDGI